MYGYTRISNAQQQLAVRTLVGFAKAAATEYQNATQLVAGVSLRSSVNVVVTGAFESLTCNLDDCSDNIEDGSEKDEGNVNISTNSVIRTGQIGFF